MACYDPRLMRIGWLTLAGIGCGSSGPRPGAGLSPDSDLAATSLVAVQPASLVDLVLAPQDLLAPTPSCPLVSQLPDGTEEWAGGCTSPDGRTFEGTLTWSAGRSIMGDDFVVHVGQRTVFELDGEINLVAENEIAVLDAAAEICGGVGTSCDDDLWRIDTTTTFYPASTFPRIYDATASGMVAHGNDGPVEVDASWSIDRDTCESEPIDGTFMAYRGVHEALRFDGALACDGQSPITVDGFDHGYLVLRPASR